MSISLTAAKRLLEHTVGPSPWYWKTFPAVSSKPGEDFSWVHEDQESVAQVITLAPKHGSGLPRLALNAYCRPFPVSPGNIGVWCPEGRNIRIACFDPDQLKPFDVAEIVGWFQRSSDRLYATSAPIAEFEIPLSLPAGRHEIAVPEQFSAADELLMPTSYSAKSLDDPAFALFVVNLRAGFVEVLPQRWFTSSQYEVGKQWITRVVRDPESNLFVGECFGVGTFQLDEDGCRLERWLERK